MVPEDNFIDMLDVVEVSDERDNSKIIKVKKRGFEKIKGQEDNPNVILPVRKTKRSAAYDIHSPINVIIPSRSNILLSTGIKAYFQEDEALFIIPRSSIGIKHDIRLRNTIGLVDSDYYDNKDNDGELLLSLENNSNKDFKISIGDRICQVYFQKILFSDDDGFIEEERKGGIGSTGK